MPSGFTYSVEHKTKHPPEAKAAMFNADVVLLPSGRSFYVRHVQHADVLSLTSPADVDALRAYFARSLNHARRNHAGNDSLQRTLGWVLARLNERYDELMGAY